MSRLRVFISHAHASPDVELARRLVKLLQAALNLQSSEIRCTSVEGYRLPGGANTNEQLRTEVHEADAFLGIVSTNSMRSAYVLFEIGARWGAGKRLVPVLAPETSPNVLAGPLTGLNALRADMAGDLRQLVNDLSVDLGVAPEAPAAYQHQLEQVLALTPKHQRTIEIVGSPEAILGVHVSLHTNLDPKPGYIGEWPDGDKEVRGLTVLDDAAVRKAGKLVDKWNRSNPNSPVSFRDFRDHQAGFENSSR